jgi:hypothetical protein
MQGTTMAGVVVKIDSQLKKLQKGGEVYGHTSEKVQAVRLASGRSIYRRGEATLQKKQGCLLSDTG